jgi:hypothetical protein
MFHSQDKIYTLVTKVQKPWLRRIWPMGAQQSEAAPFSHNGEKTVQDVQKIIQDAQKTIQDKQKTTQDRQVERILNVKRRKANVRGDDADKVIVLWEN